MEIIENIKNNSINSEKKEVKRTKNTISKQIFISLIPIMLTVMLSSCTNIKTSQNIVPENHQQQEMGVDITHKQLVIESQINEMIIEIRRELVDNGIINKKYTETNGINPNTTAESYENLMTLSEGNLIGYYYTLGKEESEKALKALGYSNWDDFLTKNGHMDKNNNPNFDIWKKSIYEEQYNKSGEMVRK